MSNIKKQLLREVLVEMRNKLIESRYINPNIGYMRYGTCSRCGKCCSPLTLFGKSNNPRESPCRYLIWVNCDGEYLYGCMVYNARPQFCKDYPYHPDDIKYIPECTYRFMEIRKNEHTKVLR